MNEARNLKMVKMHAEDRMTLAAIAGVYGISRERVRQLMRRAGVDPSVTRSVTLRARRMLRVQRVTRSCPACGDDFECRPREHQTFCSHSCYVTSLWIPAAGLLHHLRSLAAVVGRTPNSFDINSADGPHHMTYVRRFGSIRLAQAAAGLEPNGVGGAGHAAGGRRTDADLLQELQSLCVRLGHTPTCAEINASPATPSHVTYFRRFGSIRAAQERAGLESNKVGAAGHVKATP